MEELLPHQGLESGGKGGISRIYKRLRDSVAFSGKKYLFDRVLREWQNISTLLLLSYFSIL